MQFDAMRRNQFWRWFERHRPTAQPARQHFRVLLHYQKARIHFQSRNPPYAADNHLDRNAQPLGQPIRRQLANGGSPTEHEQGLHNSTKAFDDQGMPPMKGL
jgi:hypothetical protein